MNIKILGAGCVNCKKLEANVLKTVEELGMEATIERVKDMKEIVSYGVMRTPALVVDGQVRLMGQVPSVEKLKELL